MELKFRDLDTTTSPVEKNEGSVSADEIRRKLLKDFGIGVVSIGSNNIRIAFSCFAKKDTAEVFSSLAKCIASFN